LAKLRHFEKLAGGAVADADLRDLPQLHNKKFLESY
jgi:hypothetical protein